MIIMSSIQLLVHSRADPLKWALRLIPFYYALTAGILALFIVISGGHGIPDIDEMGAGKVCGIILGVFVGVLLVSIVFFVPYFHAKSVLLQCSNLGLPIRLTCLRLIRQDHRLRLWHVPMGPLLWREHYNLYLPGSDNAPLVPDYYESEISKHDVDTETMTAANEKSPPVEGTLAKNDGLQGSDDINNQTHNPKESGNQPSTVDRKRQGDLAKVDALPWAHPRRLLATIKIVLTYGITRDVIGHQSKGLEDVHARAIVYDNKVEHLWTTAQVCSAMIMSIAHGANDLSNAIGPFTTEYQTWSSGEASAKTDTPDWIKAVGGLLIGVGFWTFGYHIMRNLGNRVTKHSPTRGFSMELAAAVTVLLASRLALPVSTTQCITGAIVGVALVNRDVKSLNWRQLGKIFLGWVLTVPTAGLIAGIVMGMALNTPHF